MDTSRFIGVILGLALLAGSALFAGPYAAHAEGLAPRSLARGQIIE